MECRCRCGKQAVVRPLPLILAEPLVHMSFISATSSLAVVSVSILPATSPSSRCNPPFAYSFYSNMSPEFRSEIKTQYGSNGPMQHWRYLQKAIHDQYNDFTPDSYEAWWAGNSKQYNNVSLAMLDSISAEVISRVGQMLDETDNTLPFKLKMDLNSRLFKANEQRKENGAEG